MSSFQGYPYFSGLDWCCSTVYIQSFGVSEGTSVSDLIRIARESKIPVAIYTPQGGETVEQLSRRARGFLNELCRFVCVYCVNCMESNCYNNYTW